LTEWGRTHRFAGSKDRAYIASYVYDALRWKRYASFLGGNQGARSILIGVLYHVRNMSPESISTFISNGKYGLNPLSDKESMDLKLISLDQVPMPVRANYPDWLDNDLDKTFKMDKEKEMIAMCERAALDLRINRLKVLKEGFAQKMKAKETDFSPDNLRIFPDSMGRLPRLSVESVYLKGQVEIQDEGSQ
jgi:16S rRNA (cytosine967-C5)-methyltransferase